MLVIMFQGSSNHGAPNQHSNATTDVSFRWHGNASLDNVPSPLSPEESSLFRNNFNFSKTLNEPLPQGARGHESAGQCLSFMQQAQGCLMLLVLSDTCQDGSFGEPNTSSVGLSMHDRYTTHQQIQLMLHGAHRYYNFPSQAAGIPSSSGLSPMQLLAEEINKINIKLSELQIANKRLTLHVEDSEVTIDAL
ncbi:hypothetical protein J3A83DRAFT_4190205 [Scleroderma citrinum]